MIDNPARMLDVKNFVNSKFPGALIVDEHAAIINFEIPKNSIAKLSAAFRTIESVKKQFGVIDYALSQSTLEQVFLKQIRPNQAESLLEQNSEEVKRVPNSTDYIRGWICLLFAIFIPGLHHFWLGNIARGFKYLFTLNEFLVGWLLDAAEMNSLISKSVEENGNSTNCCCPSDDRTKNASVASSRSTLSSKSKAASFSSDNRNTKLTESLL